MRGSHRDGRGGGLSRASPLSSSDQLRSSQGGNRASGASTGSSGSRATAAAAMAAERAVTFSTADHGVVSVNLDDLSSALGVRRADVVSQRFMFQARSAPSHRMDRSLLGSAFGLGAGGGGGGRAAPAAPPSPSPTAAGPSPPSASPRTRSPQGSLPPPATPPLPPRPAPYQRRHSTLRGMQLDAAEAAAMPAGTMRVSPPPAPSPLLHSASAALALPPIAGRARRGTPPPVGSASAVHRALAGRAGAFAGSVPSPLRSGAGGMSLFQRDAPHRLPPPHSSPGGRDDASDDGTASTGRGDGDEGDGEAEAAPLLRGAHPGSARRHAAASISSPPLMPALPPPTMTDAWSLQPPQPPGEGSDSLDAAPSPSRRVHFSEDVIESIHVARQEDEYMRLVVVYSRPWYAYALLVVFGCLLGFSFASLAYLEDSTTDLSERAMSVPFVLFLLTGMSAAVMGSHLFLCWRPDSEEEQSFFEDSTQRGRLPQLWLWCALSSIGCATAVTLGHATGATVAAVMVLALACHLVVERLSRGDGGDCVTRWDVLGCVGGVAGVALVVGGGAWQEVLLYHTTPLVAGLILLGWTGSVMAAGLCWTCFSRQLRDMSQRVSQQFLLTTSLAVATAALGAVAYVIDVVLAPDVTKKDGGAALGTLLPCSQFFPDGVVLLCGGASAVLSWYAYHAVSFYVDHIASAACMTGGALLSALPIVVARVLALRAASPTPPWALPASLALLAAGLAVAEAGATLVVVTGFRHRREVEIRIVLD